MTLSNESIGKLRAVAAAILAEPNLYDQSTPPLSGDTCETACCLGGWGVWLNNPTPQAYAASMSCLGIRGMAESFGMSERQFFPLYMSADNWPAPFSDQFEAAGTNKQRAVVAVARIEHFIATDGRE